MYVLIQDVCFLFLTDFSLCISAVTIFTEIMDTSGWKVVGEGAVLYISITIAMTHYLKTNEEEEKNEKFEY